MWIILSILYVSVILPNNAQDSYNFQAQPTAETFYTNSGGENEPHISPPIIKLTIQDGRKKEMDRPVTQNPEHNLYYSNDWKRIFVPVDVDRNANENLPSQVSHQEPIFFRRPNTEENNTEPSKLTDSPDEYFGVPILYFQQNSTSDFLTSIGNPRYAETQPNDYRSETAENYQPFDSYRFSQNFIPPGLSVYNISQSSFNTNDENDKKDESPNASPSNAELKQDDTVLVTSKISEQTIKPLPTENRFREQMLPTPADFYREPRFLPQMVPPFFNPYSFLPLQRESAFQPMLPYLPNDYFFDSERGSEMNERIQQISEKQITPQDTSRQLVDTAPAVPSTNIVPQQPLPFPAPLSLYQAPFISNIPQTRYPFRPLPFSQPRYALRESIAGGPPQVPVVLPQVVPEVTPITDSLIPEDETNIDTGEEIRPEETVPVEDPIPTKTPYAFGYDMNDGKGNDQFRKEVSDVFGSVIGSYGYKDANGRYRTVYYSADGNGFSASIRSNEPGVASSGSANVEIVAERPPPSVIAEGRKVIEPEIIAIPDADTDLIVTPVIPEAK